MAKKTMEDIVAQIEGDIQNRELRTKKERGGCWSN